MELSCERCGRSSYVPDELVHGRAFRARCPDCDGVLEVPAERPNALDDGDLAWLASSGQPADAEPAADAPPPPSEVTEQAVDAFARKTGAERRRKGLVAAAGTLAAAGAIAAALLLVLGRMSGAGPSSPRERGAADAVPVAEAFDASGLVARPPAEAPSPSPAAVESPGAAPVAQRKATRLARDDRKLLDLLARKSDVSVAALPEGEAVASAASALDPAAVERTLGASRKAFDACVSKALRLNPALRVARRATLVLTVQPGGRVTGAFIAEEEVDRTELGACLSTAARRMTFPPFDGEAIDVSMPLSLSAVF